MNESNNEKTLNEHLQFTENMVNRLDNLYKQICEYEQVFNENCETDDALSLIQLLESIRDIHNAAKMLHPAKENVANNIEDLQQQMALLERSFDLLQLEKNEGTKTTANE